MEKRFVFAAKPVESAVLVNMFRPAGENETASKLLAKSALVIYFPVNSSETTAYIRRAVCFDCRANNGTQQMGVLENGQAVNVCRPNSPTTPRVCVTLLNRP